MSDESDVVIARGKLVLAYIVVGTVMALLVISFAVSLFAAIKHFSFTPPAWFVDLIKGAITSGITALAVRGVASWGNAKKKNGHS